MIPSVSPIMSQEIRTVESPTRTYALNAAIQIVEGITDGSQAMAQAVYLILNTERFRHVIYSWNYGVELTGLIGRPISYVLPEIKRRVTDALMWDKRVKSVTDFEFEVRKNVVTANCRVKTIYGDIQAKREVEI